MFRIGHGFDMHKFGSAKPLILAGINIPYSHGLNAHSDGDVIIHALCDALLGAAALGDIGQHFSDKDPRWQNANSQLFLEHTHTLLQQQGYRIANLDVTVLAEAPRLAPHVPAMRQRLADILALALTQVSIKATTTEGLGAIGHKQALACYAVVLLLSANE